MKGSSSYLFVLNHNADEAEIEVGEHALHELLTGTQVQGKAVVPGRGVMILEQKQ
ncbi:Beta-galactosidase BgaA [compost metagenome]